MSSSVSHGAQHTRLWPLTFAALGVVFGDIGTSPLYALKECFHGPHAVAPNPENILGVLSLVFWSLMFVVTLKYLTFIMRADNHGEGGILALLALIPKKTNTSSSTIALLVIFGAALLYGDGVITPAISVLSAVEGLEVATKTLKPFVIPITLLVLIGLFSIQKRGTAGIGKVFGPITLIWFTSIGLIGLHGILKNTHVLTAINPVYAIQFFLHHKMHAFLLLGAVVLVITGGEALYADMGHFGITPIRRAWFIIVLPSLLLNYFGQGSLLLSHPELAYNPFYALVPSWALYPMVAVATLATVVASQALISGAYSLTRQALELGFFPRVRIVHTSKETEGQIYIPEINSFLEVACIGLVLGFKESGALAAAYGIAVTGTMGITTIGFYLVTRHVWHWPFWKAFPLAGAFFAIDLAFFTSSATKFLDGGWFPVAMALGFFVVMTTWHDGRRHLAKFMADAMLPLDLFLADLERTKPLRVKGTAVFMAANPNGVPPVLLHHFKHNQCLHERVILLTIASLHVPEITGADRVTVQELAQGFYRITIKNGFMQDPNVPLAFARCKDLGLPIDPMQASYYLGRETLLPTGRSAMASWRKSFFSFLSRNATTATAYFGLPPNRVVEVGMQVDF